jgi:hypothetical protein
VPSCPPIQHWPALSTATSFPWFGSSRHEVRPDVAEAALNHLPPKLIRTYDRNTYAAEKRDALDKWAAHLKVAVTQATGANVTALRNRDSAAGRKQRR